MSTEFLIQFEQRMTGDNMVSELAKLEDQITRSMSKVAELEREALAAAKGLEKIAGKMSDVRARMQEAMSAGDEKGFWKAAGALQALNAEQEKLRRSATQAKTALDAEKTSMLGMADRFDKLKLKGSGDVEKASTGFKKLGGPLGKVGNLVEDTVEGFEKLQGSLGTTGAIAAVGAAGLAILAAAVVAVVVALAAGAAAATAWVVKLTDARRSLGLTIEAVEAADGKLTGLADTINEVQRSTGLATDRLLALTQDLRKAGVSADELPAALKAIATQEAALGQGGTAELVKNLKEGQTSVGALAKDMESKFGGIVERKMLSLNSLWERFQRNLSETFGGLNIEGLLRGLARLIDLFDANTESGKALRALFEVLFGPLEDSEQVFIAIERGILHVEIAVLEAAIAIKNMSKSVDTKPFRELIDVFGPHVLNALTFALAAFVQGWVLLAGAMIGVTNAFSSAYNTGKTLMDTILSIGNFDWASIGHKIVDGILGPLADPAKIAAPVEAFKTNLIGKATSAFQIRSPSAVAEAAVGEPIYEGMVGPVERGANEIGRGLETIGGATPSGGGRGGGRSLHVEKIEINGVKDAADGTDRLVERLIEILDGEGDEEGAEAALA